MSAARRRRGRPDRRRPARYRLAQPAEGQRLGEIVVHARGQAALGLAFQGIGGESDNRRAPALPTRPLLGADLTGELEAVHVGHMDVGQHQGVFLRTPTVQGLDAVARRVERHAQNFELADQHLQIDFVVVHCEHAQSCGGQRCRFGRGRRQARLRGTPHRERHGESRAFAGSAFDRHRPVHQFGEPAHDRQAEAGASIAPGGRAVGLGKRLKETFLLGRIHADAGVADRHGDGHAAAVDRRRANPHGDGPLLRELGRIGDQVEQDLPDARGIGQQRIRGPGLDQGGDLQPLLLDLDRERLRRALDQGAQRERRLLQFHAARLDLGEVQYVVDDAQQRSGRAPDRAHHALLAIVQRLAFQQLRGSHDAIHRRADLVAHGGQEGRFGIVGGLGLLPRALCRVALLAQVALALAQFGDVGEERYAAAGLRARRGKARPGVRTDPELQRTLAFAVQLDDGLGLTRDFFLRHREIVQLMGGAHHRARRHGDRGAGRHDIGQVPVLAAIGLIAPDQPFVRPPDGEAAGQAAERIVEEGLRRLGPRAHRLQPGFLLDEGGDVAMDGQHAPVRQAAVRDLDGAARHGAAPLGRLVGGGKSPDAVCNPVFEAARQVLQSPIVSAPGAIAQDVGKGRQRLQQVFRHLVDARHRTVLVNPAPVGFVQQHAVGHIVEHRLQHGARVVGVLLAHLKLGYVDDRRHAPAAGGAPCVCAQPGTVALGEFDRTAAIIVSLHGGDVSFRVAGRPRFRRRLVSRRAYDIFEQGAGRRGRRQIGQCLPEVHVAQDEFVLRVPQDSGMRQVLDRFPHHVARQSCVGFGGGVAPGESLVGEDKFDLLPLRQMLRPVLQVERAQVDQGADRQG